MTDILAEMPSSFAAEVVVGLIIAVIVAVWRSAPVIRLRISARSISSEILQAVFLTLMTALAVLVLLDAVLTPVPVTSRAVVFLMLWAWNLGAGIALLAGLAKNLVKRKKRAEREAISDL